MSDNPAPSPVPRRSPGGWSRPATLAALALLALAVVEVVGQLVVYARVPSERAWSDAAAFLRKARKPGDGVVAAPRWADPLLRRALGNSLSFEDAAPSDLARYTRLWVVSIRGHRPGFAPDRVPDFARAFGEVRVERWDLGHSPVVYDLFAHVRDARVSIVERGIARDCPFRVGRPRGGGLGQGPMEPAARFQCGPGPFPWAGPTVNEDVGLEPRACIRQQPTGGGAVRMTWQDVPLGSRLVLYGGLYDEDERMGKGAPVTARVLVDGREVGTMVHRDGDGWKRIEAVTRASGRPTRGDITVEVSSPSADKRSFCWTATVRSGPRRQGGIVDEPLQQPLDGTESEER